MAFYYYTTETIKEIDPEAIPESFIEYFHDLSDDMKLEIKEIHAELFWRMQMLEEDDDFEVFEDSDLSIEEQRIIDEWESINTREWHKDSVTTKVLVCKIIPDGLRRCKIHKLDLIKKQIKYVDNGAVYGHYGYLCPECMDLYIEEGKIERIIDKLDSKNHKMWIQPLEDTIQEWNEYVDPIKISDDTVIYIPDSWTDVEMKCPVDKGELIEDTYKKVYRDREVRFEAYQCKTCKKVMMRSSLAQKLNLECGRVGVPEIDFEKIKPPLKKEIVSCTLFKPDYFIQNGDKTEYDYDDNKWEVLSDKAILVVSYSRVCSFDDHESEDQLVLISVEERRGIKKRYLVLVGYCEDCDKYYIAQEDYEILYQAGRPNVTIYDDTNSDYYVQSGAVFEEEKEYLGTVEESISSRISDIRNSGGFVSKYAVYSGGYDEGSLASRKQSSERLQEEIDELGTHIDKPYGYRVELLENNAQVCYYLGPDDFFIDGHQIHSFNSTWGREMVNYRNIEINMSGHHFQVKRRRQFDIDRAKLFGYMEQSDEDAIFREGLTDPYLIKVLNTRKQQHQLVDIMFTIQENQNTIVDAPLQNNIIVQGCAGSGKTVVMLQRLSALKYGNPDFEFENVIVLTPNDKFNVHINGLASSLQLGYVERLSVEKYYVSLLLMYSEDFKPKYAISDEMNVNQIYVDYMYSDKFITQFFKAYEAVLEKMKRLYEHVLLYIPEILGEEAQEPVWNNYIWDMLEKIKIYNERIARMSRINGKNIKDDYSAILPVDLEDDKKKKIFQLLKTIDGFTVKSIFNEVYKKASLTADEDLFIKTGKKYLAGTRGTHRYDLYLQLVFAQKLFGYKVGMNNLICIDEGQDLAVNEYKLLKEINIHTPIFNVYGDTNQLLKTGRGISNWKSIESAVSEPIKFQLNENFRNTNQITQFCNNSFGMQVIQTGVDGHKVNEVIRNSFEKIISEIILEDERIAVLLPRIVKKKDYIDLEQLPVHMREIVGDQIGNGRICVAYVDEVKGIEFDRVFVIPNGLTRNEKYIAYTRALSELTIVFDDELDEKIKSVEAKTKNIENEKKEIQPRESHKKINTKNKSNVKYGKVKMRKDKAKEYVDDEIAYTSSCVFCGKKIELTRKEINQYEKQGKSIPKYCGSCQANAKKLLAIGTCKRCGKNMLMTRQEYVEAKENNSIPTHCKQCNAKFLKRKEKKEMSKGNISSPIYSLARCKVCGKQFYITVDEKEHMEKKGWNLPTRCNKCRKMKRY